MSGTLVCDLDGVVYLGETPVVGAAEALVNAEEAGWRILVRHQQLGPAPG